MSNGYVALRDRPAPMDYCPACQVAPFDQFMRGLVARHTWWRWWQLGKPKTSQYAIICWKCKEIVGWEDL